jgi:hypothetical protein
VDESSTPSSSDDAPRWPGEHELAIVQRVAAPHPAVIPPDDLLKECRLTSHRRGGPGGQHRNKVSSAVMLLHEPTRISAEASERRDQSQNRRVAIERLRVRLAILLRTERDNECANNELRDADGLEQSLRMRYRGRPLKISESNVDRAAVLALLMDDLHRAGGQPSLVAVLWEVSTSSLVQFVATQPAAFQLVNQWREHHGRPPLRRS